MTDFDVIVIGGGIAGVSIGYELAADRRTCLVEKEHTLAFHTTGRSAATFLETYGGATIRALTTGSRAFFEHPPEFWESELFSPRPLLQFAKAGRGAALAELHAQVLPLVPDARLLDENQTRDLFPLLRPGVIDVGMYEPGAMEVDVAGLHQGYVRGLKARGGEIRKSSGVVAVERVGEVWQVTTAEGVLTATTVVNAAGAWVDEIAELAGVAPVGIQPLLRSIFMVASPMGAETADLPLFGDFEQSFYVKPEGAQFLCSPADETLSEPCDAAADTLEIARAIDEINEATTLAVRSVSTTWGGLRSFVPDRNFVIGHAPDAPGFVWFAGQGGYGIQTAPAAAQLGAALVRGEAAPADLQARGLDVAALAADRPGMRVAAGH